MKRRLNIKKVNNIFGNDWIVKNSKRELLGTFSYRKDWKRMSWKQNPDMEMSDDCLDELSKAMKSRFARLNPSGN